MSSLNFIMQVSSEAILLTILISMPAIFASLFVGLIVAVFSATTQIQEQTLSFAPKMVLVYIVLALTGGWAGSLLLRFVAKCFTEIQNVV